jgi:serine/threonine protein phosphatase 1
LRGNHEEDLLKYNREEYRYMEWHLEKNNNLDLLEGEQLAGKYLRFLESLPYCFELDNHFIVHAGFDLSVQDPFNDIGGMLVQRGMKYNGDLFNGKTIIHGHQPFYIEDIRSKIKGREKVIPLDNGVPYVKKHKIYDHTRLGHLCALDLDSYELFRTPNRDMI